MGKRSTESARERLLSSARTLFSAGGFSATSTRAIAEHAGVNIALIAYHFNGKEGLYDAVLEDWLDGPKSAVEQELGAGTPPRDRAVTVITALLRYFIVGSHGVSALVVRESVVSAPTPAAARTAAALLPVRDLLESALRESDALIQDGAQCLALLLRLSAAMPLFEPRLGPSERFERVLAQALSILLPPGHIQDPAPIEPKRRPYRIPEPPVLDFVD